VRVGLIRGEAVKGGVRSPCVVEGVGPFIKRLARFC
jgi:hypothetical protein